MEPLKRRVPLGWVLILIVLLPASPLSAQERQVPLDEDGKTQVVTAALARSVGLFIHDYPDMQTVRLFQVGYRQYELEITRQTQDGLVRERLSVTPEEVDEIRRTITARVTEHRSRSREETNARYLLLAATTSLGVGTWGVGVPTVLGVEDASTFFGMYTLIGAASFFVPFMLTRDRSIGYAEAGALYWGGGRGSVHGSLLYTALAGTPDGAEWDIEHEADWRRYERLSTAAGLVGSAIGGIGGYRWARSAGMTTGAVHTMATFGDFGVLWGSSLWLMTQPHLGPDGDLLDSGSRPLAASMVAGAAAGVVGGHLLARRQAYTWGDAQAMRTGGYVGTLAGLTVLDWLSDDPGNVSMGAALGAGSVLGLVGGHRLVRSTDLTAGQGVIVSLGSLAGTLVGLGLVALTDADEGSAYLTGATAGSLGGYVLTVRNVGK